MNKNILLIEDEPLIQRTIKVFLEKKGAHVTATSSGTEAINHITKTDFDYMN